MVVSKYTFDIRLSPGSLVRTGEVLGVSGDGWLLRNWTVRLQVSSLSICPADQSPSKWSDCYSSLIVLVKVAAEVGQETTVMMLWLMLDAD